MSSAICFNLDQSKILSSGNGLNLTLVLYQTTELLDCQNSKDLQTTNQM